VGDVVAFVFDARYDSTQEPGKFFGGLSELDATFGVCGG
jgi:hypothetical protein